MTEELSAQERLRVVPLIDLALPDDEAFKMLDPEGEFDFKGEFGTLEHLLQIRFDWQNEPIGTKTFADFIDRSIELYEEAQKPIPGFPKKASNRIRQDFTRDIADLIVVIDPKKVGFSKRIEFIVEKLDPDSLHEVLGRGLQEEEQYYEDGPRMDDYIALAEAYQEIATGKARRDFFKGYNLL